MKTVIIDGNELTYQQAHYMLWDWLANNVNSNKKDFFESHECSFIPNNRCFACEEFLHCCNECPLYDPDNVYNCSLYGKWNYALCIHDEAATRIYALQIRDAWK